MKRLSGPIGKSCLCLTAALAAILVTTAAPVFAQGAYVDSYTLKNRAAGEQVAGMQTTADKVRIDNKTGYTFATRHQR